MYAICVASGFLFTAIHEGKNYVKKHDIKVIDIIYHHSSTPQTGDSLRSFDCNEEIWDVAANGEFLFCGCSDQLVYQFNHKVSVSTRPRLPKTNF